jgi:hypothetical protein
MTTIPRPCTGRRSLTPHSSSPELPAVSKTFGYEPLNHEIPSIRLLRVHPESSPEGYLQCTIQHATINAEYTCLSYVWGPPDDGITILLGGKQHKVRSNLSQFLEVARARHTDKLLWIDALCINQRDILERNHQVQQMGTIFSSAREVLAWLGHAKIIAKHLTEVAKYETTNMSSYSGEHWAFLGSSYWTRAWITQEVLLARRVTLCAGHAELNTTRLLLLCQQGYRLPSTIRDLIDLTTNLKRPSLIRLLVEHRWKECHVPRDRIYSLLSVCGEGSDLRVDYQVSNEEVFLETIRSCAQSLCFCSVACVALALKCFPNPKPNTKTAVLEPPTEKPFVQLPARGPIYTTLDGENRLKCWDCDLTWPHDPPWGPFLIVCPRNVCHLMTRHLILETNVIRGHRCISRCFFGDEESGVYWESHSVDAGIALTESNPQSNVVSVCLGLTWVLQFARPFHKGGIHWPDNEAVPLTSVANRMRLCDHDSHGE